MICRTDMDRFCEHDIGTCLTLRTLLHIFQNEFADYYEKGRFTAVNRNIFYRIVAYSLKKSHCELLWKYLNKIVDNFHLDKPDKTM